MGPLWAELSNLRWPVQKPFFADCNVNVRKEEKMAFLPCLLCTERLEKRIDKNRKPYFVCNPCGIQLFIRRQHGITKLEKLLRDVAKNEIPFRQRAEEVHNIQALLTEINGVKKQIERLDVSSGNSDPPNSGNSEPSSNSQRR